MGLRDQIAEDVREILEDDEEGFGQAITVTNPIGEALALKGFAKDVGTQFDPGTGTVVTGRTATVSIPISRFVEAGWELPRGEQSPGKRPYLVEVRGSSYKVKESIPGRTAGLEVLVLVLEHWKG